jgi:hypothetical protein
VPSLSTASAEACLLASQPDVWHTVTVAISARSSYGGCSDLLSSLVLENHAGTGCWPALPVAPVEHAASRPSDGVTCAAPQPRIPSLSVSYVAASWVVFVRMIH